MAILSNSIHIKKGKTQAKSGDGSLVAPEQWHLDWLPFEAERPARSLEKKLRSARVDTASSRQQARELLAPVYGWFTEGSTRAI